MPETILVTAATVEKLKQKARKIKREAGIKHNEALDQVARQAGFNHWHHVSESAKTFEPTETAYHFGVIVAMDVKDAMDFRDPTGNFVEDPYAYALCAKDLYQSFLDATDEDGTPYRDQYSDEEIHEWANDDMMNLVFFRFTSEEMPENVDKVVSMVRECSFWPAQYIWFKGEFRESLDDFAYDDEGEVAGIRF